MSPILTYDATRSRCQSALVGSAAASRSAIASMSPKALRASSRLPCASSRAPILASLRDEHIAEPAVRDRQVVLPLGVDRILLRQALHDLMPSAQVRPRRC